MAAQPRKKENEVFIVSDRVKEKTLSDYSIIVHSHLGWDWVWQRPQQFLSRLSRRHPILFVEGPLPRGGISEPVLDFRQLEDYPNISVLRMAMPEDRWFDGDWVDDQRLRLVSEILAGPLKGRFDYPIQWFYDPMAVTAFAGKMKERAVVFDCMDQLSQFNGAHAELIARERTLLETADVVFAGGPKLSIEKKRINPNTHAYGCGVDIEHFGKALRKDTPIPPDIAELSPPIFGFFGVIDERMDYDLIAKLAEANTSGNIVMVGPWTKVDPGTFPNRNNIHWLGLRSYEQLPSYAKAFNVCMVPFALNQATEYVNPTKVLEYMATGRPVIATAVEDIVIQFGHVAKI
ncbi:MAG: glycosyltransferase, partial [Verrucomicrobia bacterium]|nr:glycosyltransferase [Verrucomicrobiota bacterium]